jgi:hypothetical protein
VIGRRALLKDLQGQVRALEKDLRGQIADLDEVYARLRGEYDRAFRLGRTAATWTVWRDERVTQAAAAWVLGTVFVRFCEDNGLLGDTCYLTGPERDRSVLAEESQEEFFREHKEKTDRDWLLAAFDHIGQSQAGELLFDPAHNALYQIPVSHDAAKALIAFWRRRDGDGVLVHDFTDAEWDTRFLGDLYQDLSETARKNYALLQTPEFVEEFILDLTLTPAIDEFGYDVVKVIDPTCGSGHFLLGAFERLLAQWRENAPARDSHEIVRRTLEAVHGVDVNPFAVAIARFRLLIAALRAAEFKTFEEVRQYAFPLRVAVGDSLIKVRQLSLFDDVDELARFRYATEDLDDYPGILSEGSYHVVVGNPPYITVKDKRLNELYRETYPDVCSGAYALSVPFAQRFFELTKRPASDGRGSGYVGQITANSFMKREFGRKLIEGFFANEVDLTHIIDTSGAFIPAHGTPTVILIGRQRKNNRAGTIRTVMGIRGEPSEPDVPELGLVWQAIIRQAKEPGSESEWVSVADTPREKFAAYPWSLAGGGAGALMAAIVGKRPTLGYQISVIGRTTHTGQDEAFYLPSAAIRTRKLSSAAVPVALGESVRDFGINVETVTLFPYGDSGEPRTPEDRESQLYWVNRTVLRRRIDFQQTPEQRGLRWFDHSMFFPSRYRAPLSIAFPFVSTHNHFVLDRGGKVFNRTAPVIKLSEGTAEDDHLRLLGVLNSSTACFWLKQVSQSKGGSGLGRGIQDEEWENRYEFTGTKLQEFPLPAEYPLELARELDAAARRLIAVTPAAVAAEGVPTHKRLEDAHAEWESTRGRMIALQEELDWQVYTQYGLLRDELTAPAGSVPELKFGERAFEIVLARKVDEGKADTQWFARHGVTKRTTKLPPHWPDEYRAVVEKRIAVIESNRYLALIERPECKRRWQTDGWDKMRERALRDWLLDRCEARELWYAPDESGTPQPRPLSISRLADELRRDPEVTAVAQLYDRGKDLSTVLIELLDGEHVPFLAALRYTEIGLAKRADWEAVWDMQREEDAADGEPAKRRIRERIPVPPKYAPKDFRRNSYWSHRGKLDVPKERFISYPHAGRDAERSLLLGWAGWDHREQAQALAVLAVEREQHDGWPAERLVPILAGLREVLPWVRQWHGEFDPFIGDPPAEVYAGFLAERLNFHHLTDHDLTAWRPPPTRARP